jgi:hypothetical protein
VILVMGMNKSSGPSRPCPCGGSCDCHRPHPWKLYALAASALLCIPGIPILLLLVWPQEREPRTIHVGDQVCGVEFVVTGRSCSSTGSCSDRGYDKAVCP